MKLYSIIILKQLSASESPIILSSAQNLSSFGIFQRGSVKEFAVFLSRTLVQRTRPGLRQRVHEKEFLCSCHVKSNGLGGVVLTDVEYPSRVAFSLLSTALDEFDRENCGWQKAVTDNMYPPTHLEVYLKEYQDPANADKILAIHRDLDETKVIMHEAIESVLVRGEKLDVLVDRSRDLSRQSKVFYKTAKKHNSCCSIQ